MKKTIITSTIFLLAVFMLMVNVAALDFCDPGENGTDLEIKNIDIDNKDGDDDEWTLLNEIMIEVEIEKDGDENIDDVMVELGFFDESEENVADDLDFFTRDEEEADLGKIRDGDEETAIFHFKIPADIEAGDYELRIKAYSDDLGEENLCTETSDDFSDDTFESIEILQEEDEGKFIAFDEIILSPEQPLCGETVRLQVDVVNIGDEDQDQIKVNLEIKELEISESVEIREEVDEGEDEEVTITFILPDDAEGNTYDLELSAEYDYRNGEYREKSDSPMIFPLEVLKCFPEEPESRPPITGSAVQTPSPFDDDEDEFEEDEDEDEEGSVFEGLTDNTFLLIVSIIAVVLIIITIILIIVVVARG
jgi:hypothetical protein